MTSHESNNRTFESSCMGKEKMTADIARKVAKRSEHEHMSAYHCDHCGSWHVGQRNRKPRSAKRMRRAKGGRR